MKAVSINERHFMTKPSSTTKRNVGAKSKIYKTTRRATRQRPVLSLLLGIPANDNQELIQEIHQGLQVSAFHRLAQQMQLTSDELAKATTIKTRTLARRKKHGLMNPEESDRLVRLAGLFQNAVDLFEGNSESAAQWFRTPKTALGGVTPLQYADTAIGTTEVADLIGRLEHGIFS